MNKMLLGLLVVASVAANAQSSSSSLPTTAAPAGQTSSTTATDAAPKGASKVSGIALIGIATTEMGLRNGDAVESANYVGLNYKLSDKYTLGLRHNFAYQFSKQENDGYTLIDPEIQLKTKYGTVLGSSPVSVGYRFYVPVSEPSRNSKRIGALRVDASTEWALTPKWALGAYLSPRWTINNNTTKDGSDDVARLIASPSITYNFNDSINAYYAPAVDYASVKYVRGDLSARAGYPYPSGTGTWNAFNHEVGASFQVGSVNINPAVLNYVNLSNGQGHLHADNMEYDLNLSATF